MELHERLQRAREKAGYKNPTEAAAALRVKYPTYAGHENGSSGFKPKTGAMYARKFGVRFEWLMNGAGAMIDNEAEMLKTEAGVQSVLERIPGLTPGDVTFLMKNIRSALASNGAVPLQTDPRDQLPSATPHHESEPSEPLPQRLSA